MVKRKRPSTTISEKKKEEIVEEVPAVRSSDEPAPKKLRWINKKRVLVFASRGISHRSRHLLVNVRTLLPHAKAESKMDKKDSLTVINEICEMKNCNSCIYFEQRKMQDLYMWISNVPNGPSVKFLVENVHTMEELKMTGNCLKGSRPILSFDKSFAKNAHYQVLQELLVQVFGTPNQHPKSQPFIDHVYTFSILDHRIWFRNYQIVEETGALAEIGPRFVLNPIRIFEGSFGGAVLWDNNNYVTPNMHRRLLREKAKMKFVSKVESKISADERRPETSYKLDNFDEVFVSKAPLTREEPFIPEIKKNKSRPNRKKNKKMNRISALPKCN